MTRNHLLSPETRYQRNLEKREIVLRFLRDETYSSANIIGDLLGFKSVQAAHQTLNKMARDGFLRKTSVSFLGKSIVLFGITEHGLAYAWKLEEEL